MGYDLHGVWFGGYTGVQLFWVQIQTYNFNTELENEMQMQSCLNALNLDGIRFAWGMFWWLHRCTSQIISPSNISYGMLWRAKIITKLYSGLGLAGGTRLDYYTGVRVCVHCSVHWYVNLQAPDCSIRDLEVHQGATILGPP